MNTIHRLVRRRCLLLMCVLAHLAVQSHAAEAGQSIIPLLQERLGLSETQVRYSLGALLVFVDHRLPKPAFNEVMQAIPNARHIMQDVKMRGVVNGPLDNVDEFEATLSNLGIGQPLASQFVPAVLKALADTGYWREREILKGVVQ